MNRSDLQNLQSVRSHPALSILLPTHRAHPDNRQDSIRVRNLLTEATDRLLAQFSRREVEPLLARLETLVGEIDYHDALDGLALFVSRDFSQKAYLPFPIKERVVIGETFATRDLVRALNRTPRYWVLVLSEKPTRLYEGTRETLEEITEGEFPMTHPRPGGTASLPGGFGVKRSALRDEHDRKFFRRVDEAFGRYAATDSLPLILTGVERNLAFFKEVTRHTPLIADTVTGSYDALPVHELAQLVWPLMRAYLNAQRAEQLQQLRSAVGARQSASGLVEVWRMAQEGRVATLLVEEGYHRPARVDSSGLHLTLADDGAASGMMDDAVDEVVEIVMAKSGQVVFVADGALDEHQRLAAILRWSHP